MNIDFREVASMPPLYVRITHSEKKLRRLYRHFDVDAGDLAEVIARSDAVTSSFVKGGEAYHVVYMVPDIDRAATLDAGLLAHEATHVAQEYFRSIGEREPSDELQAYVVQNVTTYLVDQHYAWKQRQFDKREPRG